MIDIAEELRLWIWEQIDKHNEDLIAVKPVFDLILNKIDEFKDKELNQIVSIEHDGFKGNIIGYYRTREGKSGVVLQQEGTKVVHVYGEKWLSPSPTQRS